MTRHALLLSFVAALVAGCDDGAVAPETSAALPALAGPHLDLNLTGGRVQADHVEVAPGVFMLRELALSDEVAYQELPEPMLASFMDSFENDVAPPPPPVDGGGDTGGGSGGGRAYCSNYDSDYYTESTLNGTMFGGDPSWYASVSGSSYHSAFAGHETRSDYVSAYVYTYAPAEIDSVSAYGYVYINGRYVGYMSSSVSPGTYATAYGSWTPTCRAGRTNLIEVTSSHYMYDGSTTLNVSNTVSASVACCP